MLAAIFLAVQFGVCPPSGLRPRRTLRAVLWTAEEQGGVGAQQYYDLHKVLLHAYTHTECSQIIYCNPTMNIANLPIFSHRKENSVSLLIAYFTQKDQ